MAGKKESDTIEHFSSKDIVISFFGAFLVAAGFMFKGNLLRISQELDTLHLFLLFFASLVVLSAEIYFLGYSRVKNKMERPFFQFLVKRVTTIYLVSLLVCIALVMLYDINSIIANGNHLNIIKIIIAVSFPGSIGAAATDLFKKF